MTVEWTEIADGEVEAPDEMGLSSPVWQRSWRSEAVDRRFFKLSAYLGIDTFGAVVVFWECTLWDCDIPRERMTSGAKLFDYLTPRKTGLKGAVATITPTTVSKYAVWGSALADVGLKRYNDGMGDE